uniref:CPSF_A domain-containing protein n=1 Tax=Rhabditophanes sp. KR3021 TaxID=114890 RepID=A0AC35UEH1_9BILA
MTTTASAAPINIGKLPWIDEHDRITSVVCDNKLYVFDRKHKVEGERVYSYAVFYTGLPFAIYDLSTKKLIHHEVHKDLNIAGDVAEMIFVINKDIYLMTFVSQDCIDLKDVYKFDKASNEFKHLFKMTGETKYPGHYQNQSCRLIKGGADDKTNNVYFISDAESSTDVVIALNMLDAKVTKLTFEAENKDEQGMRLIMTNACYHDNKIDVFGGVHGCGLMPVHNSVFRFDLKTMKHSVIPIIVADNFGLGMSSIAFMKYLPQKDAILIGRNYVTCGMAGGMQRKWDEKLWLLNNVSTSHLKWTRLNSRLSGNSELPDNRVIFANCDPDGEVVVYGKKQEGVFIQKVTFDTDEPDNFENYE